MSSTVYFEMSDLPLDAGVTTWPGSRGSAVRSERDSLSDAIWLATVCDCWRRTSVWGDEVGRICICPAIEVICDWASSIWVSSCFTCSLITVSARFWRYSRYASANAWDSFEASAACSER